MNSFTAVNNGLLDRASSTAAACGPSRAPKTRGHGATRCGSAICSMSTTVGDAALCGPTGTRLLAATMRPMAAIRLVLKVAICPAMAEASSAARGTCAGSSSGAAVSTVTAILFL